METIQQNRKIHNGLRPDKGCRRDRIAKTGLPPGRTAPHDFLRNQFQPIICDPSILENWQQSERHFIRSLRYIEKQYQLEQHCITDQPFPLNVFETFREVKGQFDHKHYFEQLFLVQNGKFPFCLATSKPMDTGHMLYHIPFNLIVKLCRNKKHRFTSRLILCACAYLYQLAGIPSYTKNDFMSGCYEMLREWVESNEQDWEAETLQGAISELNAAAYYKKKMHRILSHPRHLSDWESLLSSYGKHSNPNDPSLLLSAKFYELYREYPNRKIYDQRLGQYWQVEDDSLMELDQYISFVWSNDGWIGEEASVYINDGAGNYQWVDEPLVFTIYDKPSGRTDNALDFEKRLLDGIDQLATILNDLNYDTNQPTR